VRLFSSFDYLFRYYYLENNNRFVSLPSGWFFGFLIKFDRVSRPHGSGFCQVESRCSIGFEKKQKKQKKYQKFMHEKKKR